jgi:serine-type D-Ala-D-Ala carboxypeptidase/endopeptidase (penicillin-binding protein 4)
MRPDPALGTSLRLLPGEGGAAPSLVLVGAGDPTLRDAPDCIDNCLRQLADAVAARGITRVADVYGDDTLFPFEPWGMGWSWNNLPFYFGAPVSALTVNGNAAALRVGPDTTEGAPVMATWAPGDDVMTVRNEAVTSPLGSKNLLSVLRWPGSHEVVLTGTLPADAAARNYFLSVPEPALTAAERLVRLLAARGITVEGAAKAAHGRMRRPARKSPACLRRPCCRASSTSRRQRQSRRRTAAPPHCPRSERGGGGRWAGCRARHARRRRHRPRRD